MIEIEFTPEDVARTRFAISPLWEVVAGVRVLKGADEHGVHRVWADQVRTGPAASKPDMTPLTDLVPFPTKTLAGFPAPPPATSLSSLEVELTTLRENPDRELGRLADVIQAYWDVTSAPYRPRIRTFLENDIRFRAGRLVEGGAHGLFGDLDPQVTWDAGTRGRLTCAPGTAAFVAPSAIEGCFLCHRRSCGRVCSSSWTAGGNPRCVIHRAASARCGRTRPQARRTRWRVCRVVPGPRWSRNSAHLRRPPSRPGVPD